MNLLNEMIKGYSVCSYYIKEWDKTIIDLDKDDENIVTYLWGEVTKEEIEDYIDYLLKPELPYY